MNQRYVDKKEKERSEKVLNLRKQIRDGLSATGDYTEHEVDLFLKKADEVIEIGLTGGLYMIPADKDFINRMRNDEKLWERTRNIVDTLPFEDLAFTTRESFTYLLDSEPQHFHGDIIITDPCYILKNGDHYEDIESNLHMMSRGTIYGDWSCTTFNSDTKEPIGRFCADSGTVAVFNLEEVLAYNPSFNFHTERQWTTTLINNFEGQVQFIVKKHKGHDDYSVHVVGKGINFVTGEPLNFITKQTGL